MKKRLVCFGLCLVMLFSATACNSSSGSHELKGTDDENQKKEFVSEKKLEEEIGSSDEASTEASEDIDTDIDEMSEDSDLELEDIEDLEDIGSTANSGQGVLLGYAYVGYEDGCITSAPSGTIKDDTVLFNGVTAGEMCDYMDKEILPKGEKLNRDLVYQFLEVNLISDDVTDDDYSFAYACLQALSLAYEFGDHDVQVKKMRVSFENREVRYYDVTIDGKDDTFVSDMLNYKFSIDNGDTDYSDIYNKDNLALWVLGISKVFNITLGE